MLEIKGINVSYQQHQALTDVSMVVEKNDFVALIGSNGAGKSTLINSISGLNKVDLGSIAFEEKIISNLAPDYVSSLGVIQVPEGRKLFPQMTVEENLEIGAYLPEPRKMYSRNLGKMFELFPRLKERRRQRSGSLSGGEQQMLAIARALMAQPKLLMLDEPSLGLAPIVTLEIFKILQELNETGLSILLVSQEVLQSLNISKRGYLLENGRINLSGNSSDLLTDPRVKESYLGF
ncbi:MAG: ABC transporter ATP-binding protein [Desulfomonilaceae bacterium]